MNRLALAVCLLGLAACSPKPADETAAAPAETVAAQPAPAAAPAAEPPQLIDPLAIGSQDARDDLYCAGIILAAHPQPLEAVVPVEAAVIMQAQNLALGLGFAGTGKMIDEGVLLATQASQVSEAWADVADKDVAAKKARFTEEQCTKRAEAAAAAAGTSN